jgi:DNA-directed RNA polymerase specialized sigma24 family protein
VCRVGSEEVAADLAGETFAAALLACGRYRAGEAPALAWLLGIARNKLRGARDADASRSKLGSAWECPR